jgi:hypothetical protein
MIAHSVIYVPARISQPTQIRIASACLGWADRHHHLVVGVAWATASAAAMIAAGEATAVLAALHSDRLAAAVRTAGGVLHVLRPQPRAKVDTALAETVRQLLAAGHLDATAAAELLGQAAAPVVRSRSARPERIA